MEGGRALYGCEPVTGQQQADGPFERYVVGDSF